MNILITGGTGSLGQALVELLIHSATFERICIYSRDEHKQDAMQKKFNNDKLRFFIGDIRDRDRLTLACRDIQIIIHAAALKIVPIAEYNPFETLKTNILGAQNLIDAVLANCTTYPIKVLAISTDKAVHPINLYGASKLCAEKLFLAANNIRGPQGPMFSICRYGNVANSNGSVIPLFREQIGKKEQLTVTHPDMTRFYITLDEAIRLISYSLDIMHGGEIFIPKMQTFKVMNLALIMMQEAGYPPEKVYPYITGIRPGEKLHEIIMTKEELSKSKYITASELFIYNKDYEGDTLETVDVTSDLLSLQMTNEELSKKLGELK